MSVRHRTNREKGLWDHISGPPKARKDTYTICVRSNSKRTLTHLLFLLKQLHRIHMTAQKLTLGVFACVALQAGISQKDFTELPAASNLSDVTAMAFAPDGRLF